MFSLFAALPQICSFTSGKAKHCSSLPFTKAFFCLLSIPTHWDWTVLVNSRGSCPYPNTEDVLLTSPYCISSLQHVDYLLQLPILHSFGCTNCVLVLVIFQVLISA